jgi:hypothetical protein
MDLLKAEGQRSVIYADRVFSSSATAPARKAFVVYTMNVAGTKGYSFNGDRPSDEKSTKFCLGTEFNQARALNFSLAKLPLGVEPASNLAKAIEYSIKRDKFNPIFIGEKNGAITVVVGDPKRRPGLNGMILVGNNDPSQRAGDLGGLINLSYSPNFDQSTLETSER